MKSTPASATTSASSSLFEVYLRLRPSQNVDGERFIDVEEPSLVTASGYDYSDDVDDDDDNDNEYSYEDGMTQGNEAEECHRPQQRQQQQKQQQPIPTHITIKPPSYDHRKRAVERFAFTRVFEEDASQRDLFTRAGVVPLIAGVLGGYGGGSGAGSEEGGESAGLSDGGQKKKRMVKGARDGLLATLGMTGSGKVCCF